VSTVPESAAGVRRFVREVLGCGCPEAVFEHIEDAPLPATGDLPAYRRLLIGQRLLIYVLVPVSASPASAAAALAGLLERGQRERDRLGLNRFRAVVGVDDPPAWEPRLRTVFETFAARPGVGADRLHLHVVAPGACPPGPGA